MFDTGCDESHRSVALMRSLSSEELGALHARVAQLSQEMPDAQLVGHREPFIPEGLSYLNAFYIQFRGSDGTLIVLTKCTPSIGISVFIEHSSEGDDTIELKWPAPTESNPYKEESEILWAETAVEYSQQPNVQR